MKGWLARPVLALAGAVLAAWAVALWESAKGANEWQVPFGALVIGDEAALVPIACVVGVMVATLGLMLDPRREWSGVKLYWRVRGLHGAQRAWWAAVALVVPAAAVMWMVGTAYCARAVLAHGGAAGAAGVGSSSKGVIRASKLSASKAPEAAWRMTMASGRMAPRVLSVSTSDSPLETLEPELVMDKTSAPMRRAAISKLVRVRVDASKKRLTMERPCRIVVRLNGSPGAG